MGKQNETYSTSDLWRAVYLRCLGYQIEDMIQSSGRSTVVLKVPEGRVLNDDINAYRNAEGRMDQIDGPEGEKVSADQIANLVARILSGYKGLKNEFAQLEHNKPRR